MEGKDRKTRMHPRDVSVRKAVGTFIALFTVLFAKSVLPSSQMCIDYSMNFTAQAMGQGVTKVIVKNPWQGAKEDFCYVLVDRGPEDTKGLRLPKGCIIVQVPVKSMVVLSSTYYAFIEALGCTDRMVGASQPAISNTKGVRLGYQRGKIKDVGQGLNVNVETIIGLNPEVIFTYATGGFRDIHPKLEEAGLKVVLCAEYMEQHPLGRAEWIKFFGLFLNRGKEAERIFEQVKQGYLDLASKASNTEACPKVVMNMPFAGRWFVPGGQNFMARLIEDAVGCYVFKATNSAATIPMDIEVVYDRGKSADYWINIGTCKAISDIEKSDPRLLNFKAVITGHVYNNNRRVNSLGGNDYWESGVLRPDRVLSDLIRIFHPEIMAGYRLFYYRHLK